MLAEAKTIPPGGMSLPYQLEDLHGGLAFIERGGVLRANFTPYLPFWHEKGPRNVRKFCYKKCDR